jgi:WD40 repeat protein
MKATVVLLGVVGATLACPGFGLAKPPRKAPSAGPIQQQPIVGAKNAAFKPVALIATAGIGCFAFSPDSRLLATGDVEGAGVIWSVPDGKKVKEFKDKTQQNPAKIYSLSFSNDGKLLAMATGGNQAGFCLYDTESWKVTGERSWTMSSKVALRQPRQYSTCAAFSPDGKTLVVGTTQHPGIGDLRLVDVKSLAFSNLGRWSEVNSVAFSPDGKTIVAGSERNLIFLQNEEARRSTNPNMGSKSGQGHIWHVTFSPKGNVVAGISGDKAVFWDVENWTKKAWTAPDKVNSIAFSPDGKMVALCSTSESYAKNSYGGYDLKGYRGQLSVWDAMGVSPIWGDVEAVAQQQLVSGPAPAGGRRIIVNQRPQMTVAFSPNGAYLSVGCRKNVVLYKTVDR